MAVMRTGLTPLEPLAAQLAAQKQQAGRTRAVLVATGSFSPIHRMHIVQFEMARTFLASCHAVDVILGYISPSHDSYLRGKLGEEAIPYEDRVEMCKLAIKDHFTQNPTNDGFTIVVDQWEGHQAFFIDFPDVSDHQRSYLTSKFPQEKFLVLFLCGMDLYQKCSLAYMPWTVAVVRPGYSSSKKSTAKHNYVMERGTGGKWELCEDVSSTKMRANRTADNLTKLTYPSVVTHLKQLGWTT
eukprot:TRINITY_DN2063_c0_g1_i2.p1 TRINITY_DN2063_c0_g1~~TRINITY_DN2063_c0_g1_i2.p1  ORF type:complete len:241 (+),score=46.30 TRINITY_DN2063_c0_g1_i2:277-999(+)